MIHCKSLAAATVVALLAANAGACSAAEMFSHGSLTLFSGPGNNFAARDTVAAGLPISVLWCNGAVDWCMVQSEGAHGWVPLADLVTGRAGDGASISPAQGSNGAARSDSPVLAPASLAGPASSAATVSLGKGAAVSLSAGSVNLAAKAH